MLWGSLFVEQSSIKSNSYLNVLRLLVLKNEIDEKQDIILTYKDDNRSVIQCIKNIKSKIKN